MINMLGAVFGTFILAIFICFFFRNPQGLYGAYLVRQVEKGNLTGGKNYYPQYFSEGDQDIYPITITILEGLLVFCILTISGTLRFVIIPILFLYPTYILIKKIVTAKKEKKAEFQEKYGENWKSVYRLYYCVGISDLIIIGWKILGFVFVIGFFLLGMVTPDSRSEKEKSEDLINKLEDDFYYNK